MYTWAASQVLGQTDGAAAARPLRARAYQSLLDHLVGLGLPLWQRAFLKHSGAHQALADAYDGGARRLVRLALPDAPTTRALQPDEQVPVIWTIDAPDDPPQPVARRRHQIARFAAESAAIFLCAPEAIVLLRSGARSKETLPQPTSTARRIFPTGVIFVRFVPFVCFVLTNHWLIDAKVY